MLGRTLAALLKFEEGRNLTVTSPFVTRLKNLPKACRRIDITTPLQSHQSLQLCFDVILLQSSNPEISEKIHVRCMIIGLSNQAISSCKSIGNTTYSHIVDETVHRPYRHSPSSNIPPQK